MALVRQYLTVSYSTCLCAAVPRPLNDSDAGDRVDPHVLQDFRLSHDFKAPSCLFVLAGVTKEITLNRLCLSPIVAQTWVNIWPAALPLLVGT